MPSLTERIDQLAAAPKEVTRQRGRDGLVKYTVVPQVKAHQKAYTGGITNWVWSGLIRARQRNLESDQYGYALAYLLVPDVRACIDVYAFNMANMAYKLIENDGFDRKNDKVIAESVDVQPRHPIDRAFRRHFKEYSMSFMLMMVYNYLLFDEIFIELISNTHGIPWGYRVLNSLAVEPEIVRGEIVRLRYMGDEGIDLLDTRHVAYMHGYNPLNDLRGGSLLQTAIDSINVLRNLVRYLNDFFVNNARPGMLGAARDNQTLQERDIIQLEKDVQRFLKGIGNQHNTFLTSVPIEFTALENADLQKQFSVENPIVRQIYRAFRVPMAMVGDTQITRFKEGQEQTAIFTQNQIVPHLTQIQPFLNERPVRFFEPGGTVRLEYDLGHLDLLAEDKADLRDNAQAGIMSIGETRKRLGLDPVDENGVDWREFYKIEGRPVHYQDIPDYWRQALAPPGGGIAPAIETPDRPQPVTRSHDRYGHTGVMVAFEVPQGVATQLAAATRQANLIPVAPDAMHITLAFLGEKEAIADKRQAIEKALHTFAESAAPLKSTIGGIGRFTGSESSGHKDVIYASVDSPDLPDFRQALVAALETAGVGIDHNHGFTPHITLAYMDSDSAMPDIALHPAELHFDAFVLAWGDNRTALTLAQTATRTHDGHRHALPYRSLFDGLNSLYDVDAMHESTVRELKKWYRFAKSHTDNRLGFDTAILEPYLFYAVARRIESLPADGDLSAAIIDVLDSEPIKTVASYRRQARSIFNDFLRTRVGPADVVSRMTALIDKQFRQAFNRGVRRADKTLNDLSADELSVLEALIQDEKANVLDLVAAMDADRGQGRMPEATLRKWRNRVELWIARYDRVEERGFVIAARNAKLRWKRNPLKDSCHSCIALDGVVKLATDWRDAGIEPRSPVLECFGGYCGCGFVIATADEPLTRGPIPRVNLRAA